MPEETTPEFWQGINQFNQKEFHECHDTLEALWMESSELEKKFYQGILQIAVACYHLSNKNWRGTVILLGEGISRLSGYQPSYYGIDVTSLIEQSARLLMTLQEAGPENIPDMVNLPKIIPVETENDVDFGNTNIA